MELAEFNHQMTECGWCIFPQFVPPSLIQFMLEELETSYDRCRKIQLHNGLENTKNTVHHLIGQGQSFMDYLTIFEDLDEYTQSYFGGKYILNSFGGNLLRKGSSYANNIHRDIRSFSGSFPLMLNTIVMLDDFTMHNGATWLMHRGHIHADKPTEEDFIKSAFQVTGPAGSVVFFNSNLWHRSGENKTDKPRRSVTPMFTRPFFKPQFDYPRALGYDYGHAYSPWLRGVLGYDSRIPANLSEWYQKPENRMYKGD